VSLQTDYITIYMLSSNGNAVSITEQQL